MKLEIAAVVDVPDRPLLFDFVGLPGARAAAVISQKGYELLTLAESVAKREPIDDALVPGAAVDASFWNRAFLCRQGTGFALLSPTGCTRFSSDAPPERCSVPRPFPKNAQGFSVNFAGGGLTDDANAALVLFTEPQMADDVTRYALLRFAAGAARWEWLRDDADPPAMSDSDLVDPLPHKPRPPVLYDGAYRGGALRLFSVGFVPSFERWGMPFAASCVVTDGRARTHHLAAEPSFGRYSSSGRYLILNAQRSKGPSKGASRLLDLETGEVHAPTLPRGYTKMLVADHCDDTFWLRPRRGEPLAFAACRLG